MGPEGTEAVYESEHLKVERASGFGRTLWRFEGEASAKVKDLKELLDSFAERIVSEDAKIMLDLRDASYVSSPFIGFLVRLVARLADKETALELWGPSERIIDLLGIVGIAGSMKIYGADEKPPEAEA